MAKIYRKTDRFKVKIGEEVTLTLSPLGQHEKTEIQSMLFESKLKGKPELAIKGVSLAIKHAVKGIEGVTDSAGNPYLLEFDNGILKDEYVEDLLNMELSGKVMFICSALTNGIPSRFLDNTGNPLPDVEFVQTNTEKK